MPKKKEELYRLVTVSLPPALLERLDDYRWAKRITRSEAVKNFVESCLNQEAGQIGQ